MDTNIKVNRSIIFFDGICNLCNSSVQFVIKRDKKKRFLFSSLQSNYAIDNLSSDLTGDDALQSIVLKKGEEQLTKSSAALTIAKSLSGLWPLLYVFMIIPKFFRDWVYDFIAKNRYKWFGKRDACMMPTPDQKSRFLD